MPTTTFARTHMLQNLLIDGPIEPDDARLIFGWTQDVMNEVIISALLDGSIKWICKNNQHPTLLAAA